MQSVVSPISDPEIGSESDFRSRDCELIPTRSDTYVKFAREIFSTVISSFG